MIRDKLNTIRSGRSLRDADIRAELKSYITNLDSDERIALDAFLDGISQIITVGISSEDAEEPGDPPANIEMSRQGDEDEGGGEEKGVVKKPINRDRQRQGLEDTSAPIQVGQKQATESLRRKFRTMMS
jgi:hypothetical protein